MPTIESIWEGYLKENMDNVQWWRDRYREIEDHGYRLPSRYHPEQQPYRLGVLDLVDDLLNVNVVY